MTRGQLLRFRRGCFDDWLAERPKDVPVLLEHGRRPDNGLVVTGEDADDRRRAARQRVEDAEPVAIALATTRRAADMAHADSRTTWRVPVIFPAHFSWIGKLTNSATSYPSCSATTGIWSPK